MDKFIDGLKKIEVEPHNSNWLKLENRLYEDSYDIEPKKNYKLWYSSIAAVAIVVITISSFIFLNQSSQNLNALDGFVTEDLISYQPSIVDGIYDITMLQNLNKAYTHLQKTSLKEDI